MYILYGELGKYPISVVTYGRMTAYWNRLLLSKDKKNIRSKKMNTNGYKKIKRTGEMTSGLTSKAKHNQQEYTQPNKTNAYRPI